MLTALYPCLDQELSIPFTIFAKEIMRMELDNKVRCTSSVLVLFPDVNI